MEKNKQNKNGVQEKNLNTNNGEKEMEKNMKHDVNVQAENVLVGLIAASKEAGETAFRSIVVDSFDVQEKALQEVILEQMDNAGLARCPVHETIYSFNMKQNVIGEVCRRIQKLAACHQKNGSYRLNLNGIEDFATFNRKTGSKDTAKQISAAIAKIMAGTKASFDKDTGKLIPAKHTVKFDIEKIRGTEAYNIHFRD